MKALHLTHLPLADQVNAGALVRFLETEKELGSFVPTRSPEAIALDAELAVLTSAQKGFTKGLKACPKTREFLARQATR